MGNKRDNVYNRHITAALLAHVDSGKTTLAEALLYLGGSIRKLGRVDNQDAFLDSYDLERQRGITIFSKQASFAAHDTRMTLLDTPGHVDFSAEMERTLGVLDYAVLVINGADGVQSHTRTLWRLLKRYGLPVFIFVNKMDQMGTDREALMVNLQKNLSDNCVDFTGAGDKFMDALAVCDEAALLAYLDQGQIPHEMILDMIYERKVFPCYFGSALKLTGVKEFMEGFVRYTKRPDYGSEFAARVFKINRDKQGNRLTWMKLTGGKLKVREVLRGNDESNPGQHWEEKIGQIRIYNGEKFETVDEVAAGSVCAVCGLNHTKAGDGLGEELEQILPVLEPVLTYRMILPFDVDVHSTLLKLRQLEEEIPELHIVWEEMNGQILVQLMGEIQTEVLKSLIAERFAIDVDFGQGRIIYKETIAEPVIGVGHFEPLRHYAEVQLMLEPDEVGSGLSFVSACPENTLDRNWQRLILTHLEEKIHKGVLLGAPVTDMRITLIAGRAHQKHTEGGDFRQATYRAVRQGLMKAKSVLLEPWYSFRLEVPSNMVGRAMTDIEKMSGSFRLSENIEDEAVLTGVAPVAKMRSYLRDLAAYTGGLGRLYCTVAGYLPCHNTQEVLEASTYDPDRDTYNPTGSVFCAHGAGFVVPWYLVDQYKHLQVNISGAGEVENRIYMSRAGEMAQDSIATAHGLSSAQGTASSSAQSSTQSSLAMDKELEEIFVRTYGKIKRRTPGDDHVIRAKSEITAAKKSESRTELSSTKQKKAKLKDKTEYLLVDGYNIIFAWDKLNELAKSSMDAARSRLMDMLSNYQGYTQVRVILVFDAYRVEGFPGELIHWHNIDVVYTKEAETADQYIEKTAHEIGRKYRVTVATSDGTEQIIIRSQGCLLMSASELEAEILRVNTEIRREYLSGKKQMGNYLLSYLSDEDARQVEDIRLGR